MSRIDIARRFRDPLAERPAIPNTDVAEILAADGFADAAALVHKRTGDARLIARTGKSDRIDRIMVTRELADAVTGAQLLDGPPGASDHHGVSLTLDPDLVGDAASGAESTEPG